MDSGNKNADGAATMNKKWLMLGLHIRQSDIHTMSSLIYPGLYLGGLDALQSLAHAEPEEQKEWCAITLLTKREVEKIPWSIPIDALSQHIWIELDDEPDVDISVHFDRCHDFIQEAHEHGKDVLVHCKMGISRSATIVIAHLMLMSDATDQRYTYADALERVRRCRRIIGPNSGFRRALERLNDVNKIT
jgi:predicted protein tyrosine phosphatase